MGEETFADEEAVVRQGEKGDALYIILSGKARVAQADPAHFSTPQPTQLKTAKPDLYL